MQSRLVSLTSLLLPAAARYDLRQAVLIALHEQCESIAAAQQTPSAEAKPRYPLQSISNHVFATTDAAPHLFPSAARVLFCCARMLHHPDTPALASRLADPSRSFSTATAIQFLRRFVLHRGQDPSNVSGTTRCPHTDEDVLASHTATHHQAAVVDALALLLHRINRGDNTSSISTAAEVFGSSILILDLIPLLPPPATSHIISLLSAACTAAATTTDASVGRSRQVDVAAHTSQSVLRMLGLLASVSAPQQLQILTCARGAMQASAAVRAAFRLRGAPAVAAAVVIMMDQTSSEAAAAAASVLPFICSGRIETPVNISLFPSLFPSSAARIKATTSCTHLSPANVSVLEGIIDLLHSCRSPYQTPVSKH